jgi:hypothetical protein
LRRCDVLKDVDFPWPIADIVRPHHPPALKNGQILESRVMTVVDVVEAMPSHRPYRATLGTDAARKEIERGRGSTYDPAVADACLKLFREGRFAFPGRRLPEPFCGPVALSNHRDFALEFGHSIIERPENTP